MPNPDTSLTHLDAAGAAHMVDVGGKTDTRRVAVASGRILMSPEALTAIKTGNIKKGDVLGAARIAAIMGAKETSRLIPLCHPLPLTGVDVDFTWLDNGVEVRVTARCTGRTGVEMEALTATSVALLTIYDMAKAIDKSMTISDIALESKQGGKSGDWSRA